MMERPTTPDEWDTMHAWFEQYLLELHTAFPGIVQSYDAATQTATIVPAVRYPVPQPDGSYQYEELPPIPSVPIVFPRTKRWAFSLPISAGDTVLVVCAESAIGAWRAGDGSVQYPGDLRRHHLSHAVAIPGLPARSKALQHASATDLVLGADSTGDGVTLDTRLTIKPDGSVTITQGSTVVVQIDPDGTVHLAGNAGSLVALANLVSAQLTTLKNAISGAAVAPNDGGATFKSNIMTALSAWPGNMAATKTNAT